VEAGAFHLFWAADPSAQAGFLPIVCGAVVAVAVVYAPLLWRLSRISLLRRSLLTATQDEAAPASRQRDGVEAAFLDSPLADEWREFLRRWRDSRIAEPSEAGAPPPERSPARLAEVLEERPLVPPGALAQLLPVLPTAFAALGALGFFATLGLGTGHGSLDRALALALPSAAWGVLLAALAALATRALQGRFAFCGQELDHLVARVYPPLSSAELAARAAGRERDALDRLQVELSRSARDFAHNLDEGLRRIEKSTAAAASLVSEEQRGTLRAVIEELRLAVRRGVERQLGSLQEALERAVEHQDAVTDGLARNFERMAEHARTHDQLSQSLAQAAGAVEQASNSLAGTSDGFRPLLEHLEQTGRAFQETASQIDRTQAAATGAVASVTASLEGASAAIREERELVEAGVSELRGLVEGLSRGLGQELADALQRIDEQLSGAVGRMGNTLDDSNATFDRLSTPIRAAEEATREMHAALDRVRLDVGNVGQWLVQAVDPVRSTLTQIEDKTGSLARALVDFSLRIESLEKTVDALRGGVGQEGTHLRQMSAELATRLQQVAAALESPRRRGSPLAPGAATAPAPPAEAPSAPAPVRSPAPRTWTEHVPRRPVEPPPPKPGGGVDPPEASSPSGIHALLGRNAAASGEPEAAPGEPTEPEPEQEQEPGTYRRFFRRERDPD
jgi:ABC-type transporter Mla subunit MlaD